MGSFRIVTGSGYGRHEYTSGEALVQGFARLKKAAQQTTASAPKIHVKKISGAEPLDDIYDKIWDDAVRRARKWARETVAEMKMDAPVDTGNLVESIHILEDECYFNKSSGEIIMVVGADLDPAGGRGKLYAPPYRKYSPKYGRKSDHTRKMPSPPDEYASIRLGVDNGSISEVFAARAEKNAKKIMGE